MFSLWRVTTIVIFLIIANAEYETDRNGTFDFFKQKYQKKYANKADETAAYGNFIKNLDKVTALNGNPKEKDKIYTINKYADVDPAEVEEHFGLNVSVYDVNKLYKGPPIRNRHILRTKHETQPEGKDLESIELYDLNDAENLYDRYLVAFNKTHRNKKYDETVHFYKFVKSLVDINKERYKGNKTKVIDASSDIVEHPKDFFY